MRALTATAWMLSAALGGCGAGPSELEQALDDTGLALYLPKFEGRLPVKASDEPGLGVTEMNPSPQPTSDPPQERARPSAAEVGEGTVVVTYTRDGDHAFELREQPVPQGSLCRAVPQIAGSECTQEGGVMRSVMEEMATVAVVRGDTLLVLDGLVGETHPGLVDAAIAVLQRAPEVSSETFAAAVND